MGSNQVAPPVWAIGQVEDNGGIHILPHGGGLMRASESMGGTTTKCDELILPAPCVVLVLTEAELPAVLRALVDWIKARLGL